MDYPTIGFKVWDYLSCKKKILYVGNEGSYTANFLKQHDLGLIIPLNNLLKGKKIIANLLTKIRNHDFNSIVDDKNLLNFTWENRGYDFMKFVVKKIVR